MSSTATSLQRWPRYSAVELAVNGGATATPNASVSMFRRLAVSPDAPGVKATTTCEIALLKRSRTVTDRGVFSARPTTTS